MIMRLTHHSIWLIQKQYEYTASNKSKWDHILRSTEKRDPVGASTPEHQGIPDVEVGSPYSSPSPRAQPSQASGSGPLDALSPFPGLQVWSLTHFWLRQKLANKYILYLPVGQPLIRKDPSSLPMRDVGNSYFAHFGTFSKFWKF